MHWYPKVLLQCALLVTAGCFGGGISAETARDFPLDSTPVDDGEAPHLSSYADVLEPARQAVVSVTTASIVEIMRGGGSGSPLEEFLRRFYGVPEQRGGGNSEDGPTERRIPNGLGSGVIISKDGYILTNNHVVSDQRGEPADEITINLADGSEVEAELVGRDARTDIALLKIDREDLPFIKMADSSMLEVGDIVFAIGNPLGVGQTSTMGIVSATQRTQLGLLGNQGYENFIQTDAAINRGNSGGPLVDAKGRLVGINTAIFSRTGGNIGIGFAIPSRLARTIVLELIATGKVRRGYLGVSISDLNPDMAEAFGLDDTGGALVEMVQKGTPADKADLQRGDVIRKIDDEVVASVAELRFTIASRRPGTETSVTLLRDGESLTKTVVLGSLDDPEAVVTTQESPLEGVALQPLDEETREENNLDLENGLIVTEVEPRSPYAGSLAPGMVIMEVNDQSVETVGDLQDVLRRGQANKFWVYFRGNRGFLALRVP